MKQLIIVAIKGLHTQVVAGPYTPKIAGAKKTQLEKSGNWSGWRLQLRTISGYKHIKILAE